VGRIVVACPHTKHVKTYYYKLRARMVERLGGKCRTCGGTTFLQFHHLRYYNDSVKDGQALARVLEVRKHPRRFLLLCKRCHMLVHQRGELAGNKELGMTKRIKFETKRDRYHRYLRKQLEQERAGYDEGDYEGLSPLERLITEYVGTDKRDRLMWQLEHPWGI
jgi:ribosomal protein S27AE